MFSAEKYGIARTSLNSPPSQQLHQRTRKRGAHSPYALTELPSTAQHGTAPPGKPGLNMAAALRGAGRRVTWGAPRGSPLGGSGVAGLRVQHVARRRGRAMPREWPAAGRGDAKARRAEQSGAARTPARPPTRPPTPRGRLTAAGPSPANGFPPGRR